MPSTTAGEPPPSTPPRPRRRWLRRLVSSVILLSLLAVGLAVSQMFLPLPVPGLRARIQAALSERLGVPVSVGKAQLWLFDRQLRLEDVEAGKGGGDSLRVESVTAHLEIEDWRMWRTAPGVRRLDLEGVRGLELIYDAEGLRVVGEGSRLVTWPERGGSTEPVDLSSLAVPTVMVLDAEASVSEERPEGRFTFLRATDIAGNLVTDTEGVLERVNLNGRWHPMVGGDRAFRANLARTGDQQLTLTAELDGFDNEEVFPLPGQVRLIGEGLELQSVLDLGPGDVVIDTQVSGEEIRWALRPDLMDPSLVGADLEVLDQAVAEGPAAHMRLRLDDEGRRWVVEESSLTLSASQLAASGEIRREPGLPVELHMTTEHAPLTLDLFNLFLHRYGARIDDGELALRIDVHGEATRPHELTVAGSASLSDGRLSVGGEAERTGRDFRGTVRFLRQGERETFEIEGVRGSIDEIAVAMPSGRGERLRADDGEVHYRVTVDLRASGELEDCVRHLPSAVASPFSETPHGLFELVGEASHTLWPGRPLGGLTGEPVSLCGELHLRDTTFEMRNTPGEVAIPAMTMSFDTGRVWWNESSIDHAGRTLAVSASIEGSRYFWEIPRLRARVRAALGLDAALASLPAIAADLPLAAPPTGSVVVDLHASGLLADPSAWERSLSLSPRGVSVELALGEETRRIVIDGGVVHAGRAEIAIDGVTIDANGVPLTLAGRLTPLGGRIELTSTTRLETLKAAWPRALGFVLAEGPVTAEVTAAADWTPDRPLEAERGGMDMTRPEMLGHIAGRVREMATAYASGEETPGLELAGQFELRDAVLTPATAPDDITEVTGVVTWDGRLLRSEGASARFGVNLNVEVVSAVYDPRIPQRLTGALRVDEADLTAWIRPWRRRGWEDLTREEARERIYGRGRPDLTLIIDAALEIERPRWRSLHGETSRVTIHNEFNRPGRFSALAIEIDSMTGYGGGIPEGHYRMRSTDEGVSHEVHARVFGVEAQSLLADLASGEPPDLSGLVNGEISLHVTPGAGWPNVTGEGEIEVRESTLLQSTLFRELGDITRYEDFNNTSFSRITADLEVGDQRVAAHDVYMDTLWINITGDGTVGFDKVIDFDLRMQTVPGFVTDIPVLGHLAGWFEGALNAVLISASVDGTLDDPHLRVSQPLIDTVTGPLLGNGRSDQP